LADVEGNAVTDDIGDVGVKYARGKGVQRKAAIVVDDGMARVGSALEADDHVCLFGKHVGNFAFSFVAPVGADNCFYHNFVFLPAWGFAILPYPTRYTHKLYNIIFPFASLSGGKGPKGAVFSFGKGDRKGGAEGPGQGDGVGLVEKAEALGREIKAAQIQVPPQPRRQVAGTAPRRAALSGALCPGGLKAGAAHGNAPGKALPGGNGRAGAQVPGVGAAQRQRVLG